MDRKCQEHINDLLSRIDERTAHIHNRQEEEIRERKIIADRVGTIEKWQNYMVGVGSVLSLIFSFIGYALRDSISHRTH